MRRSWIAAGVLALLPMPGLGDAAVASRPEEVRPLLIGASIPGDVPLQTEQGRATSLRETLAGKPALLIFHRGGWCPYCDMQLAELRLIEPQLRDMGYRIVAITPDAPAALRRQIAMEKPTYTLLSDEASSLIEAFGIAFRVDVQKLGPLASGVKSVLPVPAVFIVDAGGVIRFQQVMPDYRTLVPKDLLLAAARASLPPAH